MIKIILTAVYILSAGLGIIHGIWSRASKFEVPLLYSSVIIQGILSIGTLLWYGLTIAFFFIFGWKYTLMLLAISIFTGKIILYPIAEKIIIFPVYNFLSKKAEQYEKNNDDYNMY
ncbi:hypothetical protein [Thermincola ferriacetica]